MNWNNPYGLIDGQKDFKDYCEIIENLQKIVKILQKQVQRERDLAVELKIKLEYAEKELDAVKSNTSKPP